jgi:hypothetical protein
MLDAQEVADRWPHSATLRDAARDSDLVGRESAGLGECSEMSPRRRPESVQPNGSEATTNGELTGRNPQLSEPAAYDRGKLSARGDLRAAIHTPLTEADLLR